ncbi:P1 family peptidase [Pectinatus sottacetonis]|uniref:P1 family peptidase n=1 Tax=Pectinatus sottacetonis TaxID=1002795 RepID=UPI0018C6F876|nr:P1 family peptidase [Pectinatus sottacetonis]
MKELKQIEITQIGDIKIGNAQDMVSGTGCTVLIPPNGACCGIDIRGGGPASRETALLNPLAAADRIDAVLLSGGSAFGLDGAGGLMQYLEERNTGFDTGYGKVPLVCASCIFDFVVGLPKTRPGRKMVYEACLEAEKGHAVEGNVGAGTGATVGKYNGPSNMMKSGLGIYAVQVGELQVGAVAVVNALGDVYKVDSNHILAGMLNDDKETFADSQAAVIENNRPHCLFHPAGTTNTTIGAVVTNGNFNKIELTKIAGMAQNGLARTIRPVHTMADGDSIYALSVGEEKADINSTGTLAAYVMAKAINRAVTTADPAYGLKSAKSFKK